MDPLPTIVSPWKVSVSSPETNSSILSPPRAPGLEQGEDLPLHEWPQLSSAKPKRGRGSSVQLPKPEAPQTLSPAPTTLSVFEPAPQTTHTPKSSPAKTTAAPVAGNWRSSSKGSPNKASNRKRMWKSPKKKSPKKTAPARSQDRPVSDLGSRVPRFQNTNERQQQFLNTNTFGPGQHVPGNDGQSSAEVANPTNMDGVPCRFRSITFSSPEQQTYMMEIQKQYQQPSHDLPSQKFAAQQPREKFHQGMHSARPSDTAAAAARRRSVCYVVDVATLREAVEDNPEAILDRIRLMKEQITDLTDGLRKEEYMRKWTVAQYEVPIFTPPLLLNPPQHPP